MPYHPRNSMNNNGLNNKVNGMMRPIGTQGFNNMPNQFAAPMQNNQMGFPMGAPVMFQGQGFPGFVPQMNGINMNNGGMFPGNGGFRMPNGNNQIGLSQQAAQLQNMQNFAQLMNQSMGVPNGLVGMANMNQMFAMQMQMAALAQMGNFNIPPVSQQMLGSMNQGNPGGANPQNPQFFGSPHFGVSTDGNRNQMNLAQPSVDQKDLPSAPENLESDLFPPGFYQPANEGKSHDAMQPCQGNSISNGQSNMQNSWKHSPVNNFQGRPKNGRWENPNFVSPKNGKRKFDGSRNNGNRGGFNGMQRNNNNITRSTQEIPEPKRLIPVSYSEQEIQQWREQRRKNHPSRANKDEREKLTGGESVESEEKLRREQLKEVLAKQAELGVEVADIPSHYLMDSENQEAKVSETDLNTKDRFQNKRNKQGRNKNRNQHTKRQRISNNELSNGSSSISREPTLLQKLLSEDIKRDKHHLLQVFRFLVMNNLLEDGTEDKPLEYPTVLINGTKCDPTTLREECLTEASATLPGILTSNDLAAKECRPELLVDSKDVNWNCVEEEEGEILC